METTRTVVMRAPPERIYPLAADVERWPTILPHYRWVRVLRADSPHRRTVEMAARRDAIPVRWVAVQELFPEEHHITFTHVGGITRGMQVEWRLRRLAGSAEAGSPAGGGAEGDSTEVSIWHRFVPRWPLVPDALIHAVVGEFFVNTIAGRTLAHIQRLAEAPP